MPFRLPAPSRRVSFVALCVGGFALLQLVFFLLLVGGAAVPDKPIVDQLAKDVRAGDYGPSSAPDRMGGASDTFTECVVVGTGLGGRPMNPVRKAGLMPRISNCALGSQEILRLAAGRSAGVGPNAYYFRYWAGYTALTRPALAAFGMTGLRVIAGGLLFLSLFLAARTVGRHTNGWAAAGLLTPLVLATNLTSTPSTSFSQALSIATYLFGVALCAWAARRSLAWGLVAVAGSAALFCFIDLLTTPAIGWALSAATVAAVRYARTQRVRDAFVAVLAAGFVWPLAFASTWVSRWVLAIPFAGWSAVRANVGTTISYRTEGALPGVVKDQLWAATAKNWNYWLDTVATARTVLWVGLAVALVALVLAFRRGRAHGVAALVLLLPALVVPLWYEALRNHSQIHSFFVYRCVPAGLGVVVFGTLVAARRPGGWGGTPAEASATQDAARPDTPVTEAGPVISARPVTGASALTQANPTP